MRFVIAVVILLLMTLAPAYGQTVPLGANQAAIAQPYRIAFDQLDPANITYWKVYHQIGTTKTQQGTNIPLAQLVNGGVVVELPAVKTETKVSLTVAAVNDPQPGIVTPAETASAPFALEFLKPVAIPPGAPTNIRKAKFEAIFDRDGKLVGVQVTAIETF